MKKLFFSILLLFQTIIQVVAQNYPVQSSVQLNKPYSLYLADYVAIGANKMAVNLWLKDLTRPSLNVKLKLKIEGLSNNVRISSNNYANYPQIILDSGSPQLLSDTDLSPYFQIQNLNFERGLTQQAFLRTGKLPEGLYRFSIEAYDYFTGRKVSNTGATIAWMMLNDPPMLNFPVDNYKVTQTDPLLLSFQWTPRHTASPNAVMGVEYTLELVELRTPQQQQNPAMAFLSAQRFYTTTTFSTTYLYGLSDLPLELGLHYAWRVRASTEEGADLFKNEGWSEVRSFQFGEACPPLSYLTAEVEGAHSIGLEWMDEVNHTEFIVEYRLKDEQNPYAEWTTEKVSKAAIRLKSLEENSTYQFRVKGICMMGEETAYTEIVEAETMEEVKREFVCGATPESFRLDLQELIPSLNAGDIIWANDFDIELTDVYLENEGFSGEGTMIMPMMNFAKIGVEFDNIKVNPEMRMYEGQIYVTGVSVQPFPDSFYEEYGDLLGAFTDAYSFLNGSGDVYEQFKDFIPKEISNKIEDARENANQAKDAYKQAKKDKREAKKEVKAAQKNENTSQQNTAQTKLEKAEEAIAKTKENKQNTNKALVDAYMEGFKAVNTELKKLVKDLAEYSSGVAGIMTVSPGPNRVKIEKSTLEAGGRIMAFLKKLDGKDVPQRSLPDLNNLPKEYIEKINEINAQVNTIANDILAYSNKDILEVIDVKQLPPEVISKINQVNAQAGIQGDILQMSYEELEKNLNLNLLASQDLEKLKGSLQIIGSTNVLEMGNDQLAKLPYFAKLQMVLGTVMQGKELIEKGLPTDVSSSIEFVRQSISLLSQILETTGGFINDEGEVKDAEGWSETHWITFENVADELGFDNAIYTHSEMAAYYTKIDFGEGKEPYWAAWKAVPKDGKGTVKLKWLKGSADWSKLKAKDAKGNEIPISATQTIEVSASKRKTYYQIFLEEEGESKIVGELSVKGYEAIEKQVYIVKLNGEDRYLPSEATLQKRLNEIYGVANTSWKVMPYQNLDISTWDDDKDGKIDAENTDELATYTPEMKNIIKAYRNTHKPKGDEFVLFWADIAKPNSLDGYMPLSKRYGFIFSSQLGSEENAKRTTAHELGHGAFRLDHTWHVFENIAKGQSQNLMDYNGGTALWKWQWDLIQNPVPMIGFEQDEEEGQHVGLTLIAKEILNPSGQTASFISPTGSIVILPKEAKMLKFAFGFTNLNNSYVVPGTLLGFEYNDVKYNVLSTEKNTIHQGYIGSDGTIYSPEDILSQEEIVKAKEYAVMMLPLIAEVYGNDDWESVTFAKFSTNGSLEVETEGENEIPFSTLENFPLKIYDEHKVIEYKVYGLTPREGSFFDQKDLRFSPSRETYELLRQTNNAIPTKYILHTVKTSELANLYPSLFDEGINGIQQEIAHLRNNESQYLITLNQKLREYMDTKSQNSKNILATLTKDSSVDEYGEVMKGLGFTEIEALSLNQRILLLYLSMKEGSKSIGDKWVKNIITTVNDDDIVGFLNGLIKSDSPHKGDKSLLRTLLRDVWGLDGEEFTESISFLANKIQKVAPPPPEFSYKYALENGRYLRFKPGFSGDVFEEKFTEDGKIYLSTRAQFTATVVSLEAQPFEYVYIRFLNDMIVGGKNIKGKAIPVPAIYVYMLFNNENTKRIGQGIRLTVDIALLALGATELKLAIKAFLKSGGVVSYKAYFAMTDFALGSGDIVVNHVFYDDLQKSPQGRAMLEAWNSLMLAYGIGAITDAIFTQALKSFINKSDNLLAQGKLLDNNGNLIRGIDSELEATIRSKRTKAQELLDNFGDVIATESRTGAIAVDIADENIRKAHNFLKNGASEQDGIIDVIIHSDGEKLLIESSGTWVHIDDFKIWIKNHSLYESSSKIRLTSCNTATDGATGANLAKRLAQDDPSKVFIGADDLVHVHADGTKTVGALSGEGGKWKQYKGGDELEDIASAKKSNLDDDYVTLGSSTRMVQVAGESPKVISSVYTNGARKELIGDYDSFIQRSSSIGDDLKSLQNGEELSLSNLFSVKKNGNDYVFSFKGSDGKTVSFKSSDEFTDSNLFNKKPSNFEVHYKTDEPAGDWYLVYKNQEPHFIFKKDYRSQEWRLHERTVTEYLEKIYDVDNVLEQVQLRVKLKDGSTHDIIADNLYRKDGQWFLGDAKYSAHRDLGTRKAPLTDNQSIVYPAIQNGEVLEVTVRTRNTNKLETLETEYGGNIRLSREVNIFYNDINGNVAHKLMEK